MRLSRAARKAVFRLAVAEQKHHVAGASAPPNLIGHPFNPQRSDDVIAHEDDRSAASLGANPVGPDADFVVGFFRTILAHESHLEIFGHEPHGLEVEHPVVASGESHGELELLRVVGVEFGEHLWREPEAEGILGFGGRGFEKFLIFCAEQNRWFRPLSALCCSWSQCAPNQEHRSDNRHHLRGQAVENHGVVKFVEKAQGPLQIR